MRWTIGIPAVFIPAHKLNPHWLASHARHKRGGLGNIVPAAMAESSGAIMKLHSNLFGIHVKQVGNAGSRVIDILAGAHHHG